MGSANANARQKAAQARVAEEAAQKRRQRIINISIGAGLVVVVLAIVGGAYLTRSATVEATQASDDAALPAGVLPTGDEYQYGVPLSNPEGKPTLAIWEDFQCPACGQFESVFGPTIEEIAANGDARVIWRSTSFLDAQFPGENSQRAAAAWGCAIDAGKSKEYHDVVFANQPQQEGEGWTQEQLTAFGDQAGITGDDKATFDQCVADKTYMSWAANGTVTMVSSGVGGTPSLFLDGEELEVADLGDPAGLKKAVADAGSGQ
jgi:protein-disulfide isomerase